MKKLGLFLIIGTAVGFLSMHISWLYVLRPEPKYRKPAHLQPIRRPVKRAIASFKNGVNRIEYLEDEVLRPSEILAEKLLCDVTKFEKSKTGRWQKYGQIMHTVIDNTILLNTMERLKNDFPDKKRVERVEKVIKKLKKVRKKLDKMRKAIVA